MRQDCAGSGCDKEGFNAHINHPRNSTWGVVSVQRGKNKVTGERRIHGNVARLTVTNLTHHDDVRSLTQHCAQGRRESHSRRIVHLNLIDAREDVLYRVFHCDDFFVGRVEEVETRVQRGGLAGTGRPGHQHHAVRHLRVALKNFLILTHESQLIEAEI